MTCPSALTVRRPRPLAIAFPPPATRSHCPPAYILPQPSRARSHARGYCSLYTLPAQDFFVSSSSSPTPPRLPSMTQQLVSSSRAAPRSVFRGFAFIPLSGAGKAISRHDTSCVPCRRASSVVFSTHGGVNGFGKLRRRRALPFRDSDERSHG